MTRTHRILTLLLALLLIPALASAEHHEEDVEAVRNAVLDYVEGIYEVEPERIERSVHPDLAKLGWGRDDEGAYHRYPMTQPQLVDLASKYNKDGRIAEDAPKKIEIYEVLDKTASVKLTASWGIDYMHLAKLDGKWMIMNVLWQSHPPE